MKRISNWHISSCLVFLACAAVYISGCNPVDTLKEYTINYKDSKDTITKKQDAAKAQSEIEQLKQNLELAKTKALKLQFDATLWHKAALGVALFSGLCFILCICVSSLRGYSIYSLAGFGVSLAILAVARLHEQYPWLETVGAGVIGIPIMALAVYETISRIRKDKEVQLHQELATKLVKAIDAPEADIKVIERDSKLLQFYTKVSDKVNNADAESK